MSQMTLGALFAKHDGARRQVAFLGQRLGETRHELWTGLAGRFQQLRRASTHLAILGVEQSTPLHGRERRGGQRFTLDGIEHEGQVFTATHKLRENRFANSRRASPYGRDQHAKDFGVILRRQFHDGGKLCVQIGRIIGQRRLRLCQPSFVVGLVFQLHNSDQTESLFLDLPVLRASQMLERVARFIG